MSIKLLYLIKMLNKLLLLLFLLFFLIFKNVFSLDNTSIQESDSDFELDLLTYIDDFINLPEGGTSWEVFGETGMDEYPVKDKEGNVWTGVRPKFSDAIKMLDSKEILVQGYMFPLDQEEKQSTFLLVPFPLSCPYHPHVQSNLIIEVHTIKPIIFSYEPVNIKGVLNLVHQDDEYNIFFRMNKAKLASN